MESLLERLAFSVIPLLVLLGSIISYEALRRYRQLRALRTLRRRSVPAFRREV